MSKLEELINTLCPNGVEYKELWELTAWDKKFNAVDKEKQKRILRYHYFLASDLKPLIVEGGNVKILTTNTSNLYTTEELACEYLSEGEIVCIPWGGNPNVQYYKGKFITADNRISTSLNTKILDNKFLYYYLQNQLDLIATFYRGSGIKHPSMQKVLDLKIPVPPIAVQREIVRILDNFTELTEELTEELTARKKQYEYYRDELLNLESRIKNVEWKKLGDVCAFQNGFAFKSNLFRGEGSPIIRITNIQSNGIIVSNLVYFNKEDYSEDFDKYRLDLGDIVIAMSGATTGKIGYNNTDKIYYMNQRVGKFIPNKKVLNKRFLYHYLLTQSNFFYVLAGGGAQPNLSSEKLKQITLPIPSLAEQERIVAILDRFDKLCNDISQGLPAEIEARKKQYEYYRDKLLTFKELAE